jgi:hypothetical protein
MIGQIERSLDRVIHWVEANGYRAYDPGDGQKSFLRMLTFGQPLLERALTGAVLRAPFEIRPLLGIRPHTSTKGMGYMAWGYLRRYAVTRQAHYAERARYCLRWLVDHRAPRYPDYCWGNDFRFTTRAGAIPCDEPTIVWSGLIGQAFVDAYEFLGDQEYLDVATSVCNWIAKLPREETHHGTCLSYVTYRQVSIHNSNMIGAALLARVGAITLRDEALTLARDSMRYSCSRQNADGSWFYGENPKYHWIDNFHTGYNLDSLKRYRNGVADSTWDAELQRGYAYFKRTFIERDGCPKFLHDSRLPTDIQCCAQAIDTLTFFCDDDAESLDLACRVAMWTIATMQSSRGHFYYRDLGWKKIRTPMFHWGQATMVKALAHLLAHLSADSPACPERAVADARIE